MEADNVFVIVSYTKLKASDKLNNHLPWYKIQAQHPESDNGIMLVVFTVQTHD